ncbi:golgin subfamily A member 5 [Nematostella vectensis]|uniref:golgin subfamily A member 5 n=1 Tax=Nematostella vectensis TaxID=45351 RepID=UPI002077348B|nr:golgin subfamily A member 5 [Nematostella vectensis]
MSWFSELAVKAESLLEKVDNTAANVLTKEEQQGYFRNIPLDVPESGDEGVSQPPADLSSSSTRVKDTSQIGPSAPTRPRLPVSTPRQPPPKPREKTDDLLFEFLNSNAPSAKEKKRSSLDSPNSIRKSIESPSQTSIDSRDGDEHVVTETSTPADISLRSTPEPSHPTPPSTLNIDPTHEPPSQTMEHESPNQAAPAVHHPGNDRVSNLELENKLLRKEVSSLNEEMVSQLQRAKDAEKRAQETDRHLDHAQQQLSINEGIIRQLRQAEDDFNEALSAKDSQLAVLRVRIQEVDQELQITKHALQEHQLDRERLLQDHTDSAGVHSHALDVMKERLEDAERKLAMELEARHNVQQESMDRQNRLEQEQQSMAESMKTLQKKVQEEKNKASEQTAALKMAKANLEAARQEMKDYKEKAGRILQAKDKVISTLREGKQGDESMGAVTSAEFDEVCQERDALKEELNQTRYRMEQVKTDLQDAEQHQQAEADIAQEKVEGLESALDEERKRREACEQEIRQHMEDLRFSQSELQRSKTSLMNQIQERETEIQRLKNQIATKALTSTSEAELENRVRALTENLIQKQTVIEALSTEKNSLVLQLERLEQQYRDVQASANRHMNATAMHMGDADDSDDNTLSRVKSIASVMPSQINDSRRVKRAVNEIDKCSIRLGLFLRRYPIARLFVILYMVLLHVWVLVVLMTYKPEIHTSNSPGLPQGPQ